MRADLSAKMSRCCVSAGKIRLRRASVHGLHMAARAPSFSCGTDYWPCRLSVLRIIGEAEVVGSYARRSLPLFQHTLAADSDVRPEVIIVD